MENLGKVTLNTLTLFGIEITYNPIVFIMTWLVIGLMLLMAVGVRKNLSTIPGPFQSIFEMITDFLSEITLGTLGDEDGKKHLPFVITLFIFILVANWIGILPNFFAFIGTVIALLHGLIGGNVDIAWNGFFGSVINVSGHWYSFLFKIPAIEEPTRSVNTDLALAMLVFFIVQAYGIKMKGFIGYIRSFFDDPFPMKGWLTLLFFINPFFYLNLISALANVVSHSFRLFGNIFGGSMIIVIVSTLLKFFLVPVGLFAFFGLFAGLVQAFVFTMLAVTYIQQQQ